jgi:exopolyphosphatase/guanosine-5'-triphosphate,3'-diphosphate pyrophosphatase
MTYAAAIDIGTHSALLLVAKRRGSQIYPQIDLARTTKLGADLARTKQLNSAAIDRLMEVLAAYQAILGEYPIEHLTVFGTAAFRLAENAEDCRHIVAERFGWSLRILSGEEEAGYTFRGVTQLLAQGETTSPSPNSPVLAIDIGGGSTEVISGLPGQIQQQWSIPVGAVLLKQQFNLGDRLTPFSLKQIELFLNNHFAPVKGVSPPNRVVVTGGTATTVAALLQEMTEYDFRHIDGYTCSLESIEMLFQELNRLTNTQRADLPGMEAGREDVILPALVILRTLLKAIQAQTLVTTTRGARYGILQ